MFFEYVKPEEVASFTNQAGAPPAGFPLVRPTPFRARCRCIQCVTVRGFDPAANPPAAVPNTDSVAAQTTGPLIAAVENAAVVTSAVMEASFSST